MNFLRSNKGWVALVIVFITLTPLMFHFAYLERGYRAVGGEALFPLIPFIIWAFIKSAKGGIRKEVKND